jgi:hypothetical protein
LDKIKHKRIEDDTNLIKSSTPDNFDEDDINKLIELDTQYTCEYEYDPFSFFNIDEKVGQKRAKSDFDNTSIVLKHMKIRKIEKQP